MSNDRKTTLLGAIMAAIVASTVDLERVFLGEWREIAKLLAVVLMAVFSYYTNKPDQVENPGQDQANPVKEVKLSPWRILRKLFAR